jgi:hypothetical protein
MAVVADIILAGTAAARPAAASTNNGYVYLATDTAGGTSYRSNGSSWVAMGAGVSAMSNPLTTTGDIIYSSSGTTAARLAVGATGQVLNVTGGVPAWAYGPGFRGVRVWKSASQAISTGSATAISFDSESYDEGGFHDTVTNNSRITIPSGLDGYYYFCGNIQWATNGTGERNAVLKQDGATEMAHGRTVPSSGFATQDIVSGIFPMTAGQYMELLGFQASGGNLNAEGGFAVYTRFEVYFIGQNV